MCTGPGPGGKGNEKGTPDDQKANQLAGKGTNVSFSHTILPFFFSSRVDFPVWTREGQGPREDEVPATEQTLLPNLKILISVVVRSHSSSIWRTCVEVWVGSRFQQNTFSHVVWRGGWLWTMESW